MAVTRRSATAKVENGRRHRSKSPSPGKTAVPTVQEWLKSLPPDRAAEVEKVRAVIRERLPAGYQEVVRSDMIAYEVPLERYPDTYNGQALWYVALGAPRSYLTLHLMPVYGSPALADQLKAGFRAAGKKLDIGKACVHFRRAEDLALDAVGAVVASTPMDKWIAIARAARRR